MNPNEPAFPSTIEVGTNEDGTPIEVHFRGVTVRDWLAAQAMQGMLSMYADPAVEKVDEIFLANEAYKIADAMIAQSNKEPAK